MKNEKKNIADSNEWNSVLVYIGSILGDCECQTENNVTWSYCDEMDNFVDNATSVEAVFTDGTVTVFFYEGIASRKYRNAIYNIIGYCVLQNIKICSTLNPGSNVPAITYSRHF